MLNLNNPLYRVHDSSKIQKYMVCERLYFFKYVLGLNSENPIHNLIFGSCFHLAKEVLFLNGYSKESIDKAMDAFLLEYRKTYSEDTDDLFKGKFPGNVEKALLEYTLQFQTDTFETLFTEVAMSVPIGHDRIIYGKLDAVLKDGEKIFSLETKTSGALWAWWADQWLLKFQIDTYSHFLYSYFDPKQVEGIIIDGTIFRKNDIENLRVNCKRSFERISAWLWEANRHFDNLERDFEALANTKEDDLFMPAFPRRTECCIQYNRMCEFQDICAAWHNPLQHLNEVPSGYKIEHWDPRKEDAKVSLTTVGK